MSDMIKNSCDPSLEMAAGEHPVQEDSSESKKKISAQEEWQLNKAAIARYGKSRQWKEALNLLTILSKKHKNREIYKALAQRIWIALKSDAPVTDVVLSLFHLLNTLGPSHDIAGPLAALAHLMAKHRTPEHPDQPLAHAQAQQMFALVLDAVGIVGDEAFAKWVTHNRLNDPNHYVPIVMNCLEVMVGDDWWFDRALLQEDMVAAVQV